MFKLFKNKVIETKKPSQSIFDMLECIEKSYSDVDKLTIYVGDYYWKSFPEYLTYGCQMKDGFMTLMKRVKFRYRGHTIIHDKNNKYRLDIE